VIRVGSAREYPGAVGLVTIGMAAALKRGGR